MTPVDATTVENILREEISNGVKPILHLARLKEKLLLTEKEVEELYGIPVATLQEWRKARYSGSCGPQYWKKANRIYYSHAAIMEFMRNDAKD